MTGGGRGWPGMPGDAAVGSNGHRTDEAPPRPVELSPASGGRPGGGTAPPRGARSGQWGSGGGGTSRRLRQWAAGARHTRKRPPCAGGVGRVRGAGAAGGERARPGRAGPRHGGRGEGDGAEPGAVPAAGQGGPRRRARQPDPPGAGGPGHLRVRGAAGHARRPRGETRPAPRPRQALPGPARGPAAPPDPVSPQLADSEFSPVFRLLTIFAYGTYADYLGEAGRGAGVPGPPGRCGDPAGRERRPGAGGRAPPSPDTPRAGRAEPPGPHTPGCALGPRLARYLAVIDYLPLAKEHPEKTFLKGRGKDLGIHWDVQTCINNAWDSQKG